MVRRLMRAAALALGLAAASAQQSSESGKEFATSLTPGKAATDSQSSNMYVGTPGTSTMWIQPVLTNIDPDAVCNDGTPGMYYFSPGTGAGANLWLVYLEGGYWCYDEASCKERYTSGTTYMSSSNAEDSYTTDGIFTDAIAADNVWADANMVFIKYCSSDSWMGDAAASSATFGFAFRGARIIDATMQSLVSVNGLGKTPGAKLLFGGCSAGGRGVVTSLDKVKSDLASIAPSVEVKGLNDAGGWVDVQPAYPNLLSLQNQTAAIFKFSTPPVGATTGGLACLADFPDEPWKCVWPSYRLPFVTTPYVLNAAQFDSFLISYNTNHEASNAPGGTAYLEQYQTATLALFAKLPATVAIWSSTCFIHCVSSNADYFCFTVDGKTLNSVVNEFVFDATVTRTISSCSGWACTNACAGGPLSIWEPENLPPTATPYCTAFYDQIQASDANVNHQIATSEHSDAGGQSQSQQHLATSMLSQMGVTALHPTTTSNSTSR